MRSQEFPCGWQGDFNVVTFIIFNVAFITEGDTAFDLADSGEILVSKDEANDYYIFFFPASLRAALWCKGAQCGIE